MTNTKAEQTGTTQETPDTPQHQANEGSSEDRGYPANTPVAEMTDAQRANYWAYHARKHEARARARDDYDAIKAELQEYRDAAKTDAEKALDAAREEARAGALAESQAKLVGVYVRAKLGKDGDVVAAAINPAAFVADDGELKTEELEKFLSGWAAKTTPPRDPHQGQRQTTRASGMQAGRDLARPKKNTN